MADAIVRGESPTEYFRELVESTLEHQHVEASQLTAFYLVSLLAGFIHRDRTPAAVAGPLGVRLLTALQAGGSTQREGLKEVGDASLFISGFFAASLNRRLVDIDYYIGLGEQAYRSLARRSGETFSHVFDELAARFPVFVDVLGEISERTALTSNADLLRLYERWLRTGSRRSGDLLTSRGIVANGTAVSRFTQ
jgi:hypothetical protein